MPAGAAPLQLFFRLDHTSSNVAQWRTFDFVYCNQGPWASAQAFLVRPHCPS